MHTYVHIHYKCKYVIHNTHIYIYIKSHICVIYTNVYTHIHVYYAYKYTHKYICIIYPQFYVLYI